MSKAAKEDLFAKLEAAFSEQAVGAKTGQGDMGELVESAKKTLDALAKKATAEHVNTVTLGDEAKERLKEVKEAYLAELAEFTGAKDNLLKVEKTCAARSDEITGLKGRVAQLEQTIAEGADASQASKNRVETLEKQLKNFDTELKAAAEAKDRIKELEASLSTVRESAANSQRAEERVSKLEEAAKTQAEEIENANVAKRRVAELEKHEEKNSKVLQQQEELIKNLKQKLESLEDGDKERVRKLEDSLKEKDTAAQAAESRVAALEKELKAFSQALEDANQSDLKERVKTQEEELKEKERAHEVAASRIDELEKNETALKVEAAELLVLVERAVADKENHAIEHQAVQNELLRARQEMSEVERRLRALSVSQADSEKLNRELEETRVRADALESEIEQLLTKNGGSDKKVSETPKEKKSGYHKSLEGKIRAAAISVSAKETGTRVGEILVDSGVITPKQLEKALVEQARSPDKLLGVILIEKGYAGEDSVGQAVKHIRKNLAASSSDDGRRRVGRILVEAGVVTKKQLEDALGEQKKSPNTRIGTILARRGFASEDCVAQALGFQRGVEFVRIRPESIESDAAHLINPRLAEHHCCIPLRIDQGKLVLAMVNPLDLIAIEDVERASEFEVEPVVATATDINDSIQQHYY